MIIWPVAQSNQISLLIIRNVKTMTLPKEKTIEVSGDDGDDVFLPNSSGVRHGRYLGETLRKIRAAIASTLNFHKISIKI